MNYDPIHDTFVTGAVSANATGNNSATPSSTNGPNGGGNGTVPTPAPIGPPISASTVATGQFQNPYASLPQVAPVQHIINAPSSMAHLMAEPTPSEVTNISTGVQPANDQDDYEDNDNDNDHDLDHDNEDDATAHSFSVITETGDSKSNTKIKKPVSASIPKGVRYLKKSDGEPFWRKDIQYDFLEALFNNDQRVFTNPFPPCSVSGFYDGPKYTFGELYVRTLAESPKCSKVLKERLLKDPDMGTSVAKVCLLVNTGRMNTTINFVPEMRSTLRTYHSIPSLQADPVTGSSKQLQDTPRLKSILKAVSDMKEDFKTIEDLVASPPQGKPNTNLVLLLFLLSNNVNGIKFHHLHTNDCHHASNSFMEFFLETKIHPKSRASRFLWLMYTYLETSFTPEELALNPFHPHEIPAMEYIDESQMDNFDKDTDYEIEYSERMFRTRLKYLADEEHNTQPKRGNKSKKDRQSEESGGEEEDKGGAAKINGKRKIEDKQDKQRKKQNRSNGVSSPTVKSTNGYFDLDRKPGSIEKYQSNHLKFPAAGIKQVIELNKANAARSPYREPSDFFSKANKKVLMAKFQQSMKNKKVNTEEVQNGIKAMEEWGIKFFQYKKSVGNGLLDMEWEDIRYEMINGLEEYLYRVQGGDPTLQAGEKDQDKLEQTQYEPIYEYETDGQKSSYVYALLHKYTKWSKKPDIYKRVSFDLDNEKVDFI